MRSIPLTLLFPGGSLADMERLYRTSAPAKTYNRLIAEAVTTLHQSWSADRPMRVLEIGGGTGSTTSYTLPVLPEADVEYTFTDVSPLFLNRARDAFGDRRGMRFAVLDIASDPLKQGFAAERLRRCHRRQRPACHSGRRDEPCAHADAPGARRHPRAPRGDDAAALRRPDGWPAGGLVGVHGSRAQTLRTHAARSVDEYPARGRFRVAVRHRR